MAAKSRGKGKSVKKQIPSGLILTLLLLVGLLVVARVYVGERTARIEPVEPPVRKDVPILTFDDRNFTNDLPVEPKAIPEPLATRAPVKADVCLVIDDVGANLRLAGKAAADLPPSTTFAVIPGLKASESSANLLHSRGFHIIAHIPMEPQDGDRWKPTPTMLMVGMGRRKVDRILKADLADVPYAEGINNHMGSRATSSRGLMEEVMEYLKPRGYYFLDSRTSAHTVAYETARSENVPSTERKVFLDDVNEVGAITAQMDRLVARAETEGRTLVAIGHLRPKTIAALSSRTRYWKKRGVRFVALKEVVH